MMKLNESIMELNKSFIELQKQLRGSIVIVELSNSSLELDAWFIGIPNLTMDLCKPIDGDQ